MARIYRADGRADAAQLAGCSCALGVFDGVHLGHRYLVGQAVAAAQEGASAIITFDRDPDELFAPGRLKKLQGNDSRIAMLSSLGADMVFVIPFTRRFAAQASEQFVSSTFGDSPPAHLHVGAGFRFGSKGAGTTDDLRHALGALGCQVHGHDLVKVAGSSVTSTRIRALLAEGQADQAAALLGRPYALEGTVQKGRGDGTGLGFATANLHVESLLMAAAPGVYAGYATVAGVRYRAAIAVGESPMFAAPGTKAGANVEVHIIDFEGGDIYGQGIKAELCRWIRPMKRFASVDELVATVSANIAWVRDNMVL